MTKNEIMEKARAKRKPIKLFDSREYSIFEIPLNYKIYIKLPTQPKFKSINRDCYSMLKNGIEQAHEVAREQIKDYFIDKLQ